MVTLPGLRPFGTIGCPCSPKGSPVSLPGIPKGGKETAVGEKPCDGTPPNTAKRYSKERGSREFPRTMFQTRHGGQSFSSSTIYCKNVTRQRRWRGDASQAARVGQSYSIKRKKGSRKRLRRGEAAS